MKIVINDCYGGFGLSDEAMQMLGVKRVYDIARNDARLVEVVETLGDRANRGRSSDLVIVTIPDEATDWIVSEYDGVESVIYVLDGKIQYA